LSLDSIEFYFWCILKAGIYKMYLLIAVVG